MGREFPPGLRYDGIREAEKQTNNQLNKQTKLEDIPQSESCLNWSLLSNEIAGIPSFLD
jgi:hypothetical protein